MAHLPLEPIGKPLDQALEPDRQARNRAWMEPLERTLEERRGRAREGWGERALAAVRASGRWTAWERVDALRDPGTPLLPLGSLVHWGRTFGEREAVGAGVITALARVHGRHVVVIANDNLLAAGAWWPGTPEKIQRAQTLALRLALPVVYLVESSGLFLPEQAGSFGGRTGAGHIFKLNALLSDRGVPQIAGVFGPCIAGGGYMPIISDRVVMTEQAYMVIAGQAVIRGAKSLALGGVDLGGPEVHVHVSGVADLRVPDDETCLLAIRAEVTRLPSSAADFYRGGTPPLPPRWSPSELTALIPPDHREPCDLRQVLARLLDGSLFHEFLPGSAPEVVTGYGRIQGLWVGVASNDLRVFAHPRRPGAARAGGTLYREGVARLATFSRTCEEDGVPILWFQDVAGFDIGPEAEAQGLLGFGSSLLYTNSTNLTPMITVLLRRASGAGYYAQAGLPFDPVVQLATPCTRLGVMEGRTLATASQGSRASESPEPEGPAARARERVAERIERDMDPYEAASRGDVDELVTLPELRGWLEELVDACYQATGNRRVRNPRIRTVHDLEVLCSGP